MRLFARFLLALYLGLFYTWLISPARAQIQTSPNLVPNPGHWTLGGQSVNQAFAINQALGLSGSPVRIHGFEWGYTYSLDAGGSVTSNTVIQNSAGQTLHSHSSLQNNGPTYGLRGADYSWTMSTSLPQTSLGNFNYTLAAQGEAVVFDSYARARYTVDPVTTSGNVVYSTVNQPPPGSIYSWSGFQITESQGGGLSGGNVPGYNISTGQFMFGYAQGTINYAVALNSVLAGAGIQVGGMEYGFQYFNQDFSRGTLSATFGLQSTTGQTLQSYSHVLPQTTAGWTNFDQTKTWWGNTHLLSTIGNATMSVTGRDDRFWAGYYGPQFRSPYIRFNYTADQCAVNPLSDPNCPGYAAALFTQQCAANPLTDPTCPGYAAAYFTQQCTISALYNPACPGYAAAFLQQQCTANPLYSEACPGYQTAAQQCTANPLTAAYCSNYQTATSQCAANSLSASYCPGYSTALTTCSTNPLSNNLCPGYTAASQTCSANQLTYSYCPSYTTALAACGTNPQSNTMCPGYSTASTASSSTTASPVSTTRSVTEATVAVDSSGRVETTVSKTGDSNVDKAITATTTSATPSATAPVQLAPSSPAETRAVVATSQTEQKSDSKGSGSSSEQRQAASRTEPKQEAKTDSQKQQIQQAAQARAKEEMKKAETASSFEGQVAVQQVVIGAMSFVPGFESYGTARIVDINAVQLQRQYGGPVVDNQRVMRQLSGASDRLHRDMVDQQWR